MKLLIDLCNHKPSQAIRAMVSGLREIPGRDFEIDMGTFGDVKSGTLICVGCAATCALQKLANERLTSTTIESATTRAARLNLGFSDLLDFEDVIESLRLGGVAELADFFCVQLPEPKKELFPLTKKNYLQELGAYEAYAEQLERLDL